MQDWRDRLRELGFGNQAVIVGTKRRELFDEIEKIRKKEGIDELRVWIRLQWITVEELKHKGCGNHNGNNECCRNETLELVLQKLNQLKGSDDNS